MDSEKYIKLEQHLQTGGSPVDEGPFYHHSFWEGYKGSIKGKLGGIVIGAAMGAAVGGLVAAGLGVAVLFGAAIETAAIGLAFAGITGAGILYGMLEFNEIGKIDGVVASGLEQKDSRDAIRMSALEKKIDAMSKTLGDIAKNKKLQSENTPAVEKVDTSKEDEALATYRKSHYARLNGSTKGPIFWKIAVIGLAVGVAAGLILSIGGGASIAGIALQHAIGEATFHTITSELGTAGIMAVTTGIMGAFGASFGLNRDYFRKIFDTTDLWTRGIVSHKKVREHQEEAGKQFEKEHGLEHKKEPEVATAIAPESGYLDYPASATFHRDRAIKNSQLALQELDHTRATPH